MSKLLLFWPSFETQSIHFDELYVEFQNFTNIDFSQIEKSENFNLGFGKVKVWIYG